MARVVSIVAVAAVIVALFPAQVSSIPRGTRVQAYKRDLKFPVDMAWVKGTKKIFFTEKNTGKIRMMKGRRLRPRACANLDVATGSEQGALGITLHPGFKKNRKLYVYYTNDSPRENRVARFTVRRGRCRNRDDIITGIPTTSIHNGGQLIFVGGKLFVSVGDHADAANAQNTTNRLGKILRYNANGTIPDDNPFSLPGNPNPVWSYGHRNPFGLAVKPGTRKLFETENGPQCDDELNRIRKERNYGWGPNYECGTAGVGPDPKGPLLRWESIIVPTDPWWYRGRLKAMSGSLYVGDFAAGRLHRIVMNKKATRVRADRVVFDAAEGIVDVSKGPGGWLYFLTPSAIFRIART